MRGTKEPAKGAGELDEGERWRAGGGGGTEAVNGDESNQISETFMFGSGERPERPTWVDEEVCRKPSCRSRAEPGHREVGGLGVYSAAYSSSVRILYRIVEVEESDIGMIEEELWLGTGRRGELIHSEMDREGGRARELDASQTPTPTLAHSPSRSSPGWISTTTTRWTTTATTRRSTDAR